ncbi:MAG: restriction endonuclease [Cyanobacteria bacterium P01_A01_bin.40]
MRFNRKLYQQHLSKQRKQTNIAEGKQLLEDLRKQFGNMDEPLPAVIGTLRRCNPFVFEELLLHIFAETAEFKIVRNRRYTGDGGIDGRFYFDDYPFLIQAKRYRSHINPQHIEEFAHKIKIYNAEFGLFIHTGKTGNQSWQNARSSRRDLMVISGQKLVDLVLKGNAEDLLVTHLQQTI